MAETQVPFAAGKAAALSSYLSRGGAISKKGTYTKGKMKGKSPEEVTAAFETLWANVDGSIKDKYAKRASPEGALSPSEQKAMGKEKMWQMGKDLRPETVTMPAMKTVTNPSATTESDDRKSSRGSNPTGPSGANPRGPRGGAPKADDDDGYTAPTTPVGTRKPDQSTASNGPGKPITTSFTDLTQAPGIPNGGAMAVTGDVNGDGRQNNADADAARNLPVDGRNQPVIPAAGTPPGAPSPTPTQTPADLKAEESRKFANEAGARAVAARANNTPEQNQQEMNAAWRSSQALPSAKQQDEQRIMDAKKANPSASNPMAIDPDGTTPGVIPSNSKPAPAIAPQVSALREAPDFTPGPGKELTGMSGGRPTYSSADSLYGEAKPSIPNTIATTSATADPKKPVMIEGQSIEQRRADYQTRQNNTPGQNDAANNALRTMGITPTRESTQTPVPRGPASQPEPKYQSPIAKGGAFSDEAYASTSAAQARGVAYEAEQAKKPTMDDVNRSFKPGTPEHTAAAWGVNAKTGEQLTKEDTKNTAPTSSRVVSSRPATAQESKDGKVREIPAIQPTPEPSATEPSAKSKPKFARR